MIIDRRTFIVGSAAGAAAFVTPLLDVDNASAGQVVAIAAARARLRDHAVCDPWLAQFVEGAPRLVIHEMSGAVFRPADSSTNRRAQSFVLDRIWTDYVSPYPVAHLDFESNADGSVPMLRQSIPPGLDRSGRRYGVAELEAIRAAVAAVVDRCLERAKPRDVWIMVRPETSGESLVIPTPASGLGAPDDWAFPSELRAKLDPAVLSA